MALAVAGNLVDKREVELQDQVQCRIRSPAGQTGRNSEQRFARISLLTDQTVGGLANFKISERKASVVKHGPLTSSQDCISKIRVRQTQLGTALNQHSRGGPEDPGLSLAAEAGDRASGWSPPPDLFFIKPQSWSIITG